MRKDTLQSNGLNNCSPEIQTFVLLISDIINNIHLICTGIVLFTLSLLCPEHLLRLILRISNADCYYFQSEKRFTLELLLRYPGVGFGSRMLLSGMWLLPTDTSLDVDGFAVRARISFQLVNVFSPSRHCITA